MNVKPYLPSAIRAILGLGENDPFEIEAWFLSHAHRDHYYELAKMLNAYTPESNYRINNFYFDFPDYGVEWESRYATDFDNERFQKLVHGVYNYYSQTESPDGTGPEDETMDTFSPCWMLNERFQGKGYAYEAARAYFDYLFNVRDIRRIYAYAEDYNLSSQRLCEKLGMRREGF